MPLDLWLLVLTLVVLLPVLGYWRFRLLARRPGPLATAVKLRAYATAAATQWALVAWCAVILGRRGRGLASLGLDAPVPALAAALAAVATVALVGVTLWSMRGVVRSSDPLPSSLERVLRILPGNRTERLAFGGVAVTAGFCEEVLYRGFLIWSLGLSLANVWLAVVLAGIAFGAGHAYQGRQGVITTGLLGIFLGLLYVWSGSLWPAVALHFAVDLANGYALGEVGVIARERESQAAREREAAPAAAVASGESAPAPLPGRFDASGPGPA